VQIDRVATRAPSFGIEKPRRHSIWQTVALFL
jgi:hypothetical protein